MEIERDHVCGYRWIAYDICGAVFVPRRRKRGEKGEVVETVEDVIVRRLTTERIDELKRLIKDTQEKHRYARGRPSEVERARLSSAVK